MTKRIVVPAISAGMIALVVVLTFLLTRTTSSDADTNGAGAVTTVPVTVRDLTRTMTLDGVIAHPNLRELTTPKTGTITGLPKVGDELGSGQVLMRVDDRPVVLLNGPIPAWRDMGPGIGDGEDIRELEQALLDLGHGTKSATFPDADWGTQTTEAVKKFQTATGAVVDGVLSLGEVIFTDGDIHIAKVSGILGGTASPEASVLTVSGTGRTVIVNLDPLDRDLIIQGAPVQVELPSGHRVPGVIETVSTTLELNADNKQVFKVTIVLKDADAGQSLDLAPVTVHDTTVVAKHVLTVPATAILGVPGGGYAVDVVGTDGSRRRVTVKPGAWGDGYVQVSGDLAAGDLVEVPQ